MSDTFYRPGRQPWPKALKAKLATSHGRPSAVCVEIVDGTNTPPLVMLSPADAMALAADLLRIAGRVPAKREAAQYPRESARLTEAFRDLYRP